MLVGALWLVGVAEAAGEEDIQGIENPLIPRRVRESIPGEFRGESGIYAMIEGKHERNRRVWDAAVGMTPCEAVEFRSLFSE